MNLIRILQVGTNCSRTTSRNPRALAKPIDIRRLEQRALNLMAHGIATSTRRTYTTAQRRFIDFCHTFSQLTPSGFPCPASERTLISFVAHLSDTLKVNSIKVYLAGVRSLHIEQGLPNPHANKLRLERILRGIKRIKGEGKRDQRPVTIDNLRRFEQHLVLTNHDDAMFWAACCLGFFGFLRAGEFTVATHTSFNQDVDLSVSDIRVDRHNAPKYMLVNIKASKTDPCRKGITVRLTPSGSSICAVRAVMHYLHFRGNKPGPLFLHQNGKPLTRTILSKRLQEIATRTGLPGNFSGHSFRIGAATTAAQKVFQITSLKHLVGGRATRINRIYRSQNRHWTTYRRC